MDIYHTSQFDQSAVVDSARNIEIVLSIVLDKPYLTEDAVATLVKSTVTLRLDYLNALLYGLSQCLLWKLELVQSNAARLILWKKKRDHARHYL